MDDRQRKIEGCDGLGKESFRSAEKARGDNGDSRAIARLRGWFPFPMLTN